MFLFESRKKNHTVDIRGKTALPQRLQALHKSHDVAWMWDNDYQTIVWANQAGLDFWRVSSRQEIKELIFPENHPLVLIADTAQKATQKYKIFSETLLLRTGKHSIDYECFFEKHPLPDKRDGLLVVINATEIHEKEAVLQENNLYAPKQDEHLDELHDLDVLEAYEKLSLESEEEDYETERNFDEQQAHKTIPNDYLQRFEQADSLEKNIQVKPVSSHPDSLPMVFYVHRQGKIVPANEGSQQQLQAVHLTDFSQIRHESLSVVAFWQSLQKNPDCSARLIVAGQSFLWQSETVEDEDYFLKVAMVHLPIEKIAEKNLETSKATSHHASMASYEDRFLSDCDSNDDFLDDLCHQELSETISQNHTDSEDILELSGVSQSEHAAGAAYMASLLNIVDGSTVGLFMVDGQGKIISVNPYGLQLLGLYQEDVLDKNITSLFDIHTAEKLINCFSGAFSHAAGDHISQDFFKGVDCLYHGHDNASKNGFLVLRPHPHQQGHYWVILNDTTEIRNLKQQISLIQTKAPQLQDSSAQESLAQEKNAYHTDKMIPNTVAMISHELRAPLNAISGYIELIKSQPFGVLSPEYLDYISKLETASHHAVAVVGDLLDYSHIEAGGIPNHPQSQDVGAILEKVRAMCTIEAEKRGIHIEMMVLPQTPLLCVDGKLLTQVLLNLLSNAIKYSDDNEHVQIISGLTKTGRFMIEIVNYGKGFTPEQLEVILKPYGRVNVKDSIVGTGLGIPVAKRFLEIMQGQFMIDSVPNDKTRARILFDKDKILESLVEAQ